MGKFCNDYFAIPEDIKGHIDDENDLLAICLSASTRLIDNRVTVNKRQYHKISVPTISCGNINYC